MNTHMEVRKVLEFYLTVAPFADYQMRYPLRYLSSTVYLMRPESVLYSKVCIFLDGYGWMDIFVVPGGL